MSTSFTMIHRIAASEAYGWSDTVGILAAVELHIRTRSHPVVGCAMKMVKSAAFAESPPSQAYDLINSEQEVNL
jgi:hypothetical protein